MLVGLRARTAPRRGSPVSASSAEIDRRGRRRPRRARRVPCRGAAKHDDRRRHGQHERRRRARATPDQPDRAGGAGRAAHRGRERGDQRGGDADPERARGTARRERHFFAAAAREERGRTAPAPRPTGAARRTPRPRGRSRRSSPRAADRGSASSSGERPPAAWWPSARRGPGERRQLPLREHLGHQSGALGLGRRRWARRRAATRTPAPDRPARTGAPTTPASGTSARFTKGKANFARSEANTRSQWSSSVLPMPMAAPSTAAMSGLEKATSAWRKLEHRRAPRIARRVRGEVDQVVAGGEGAARPFEEDAAHVRSLVRAGQRLGDAAYMAPVNAFFFSGRWKTIATHARRVVDADLSCSRSWRGDRSAPRCVAHGQHRFVRRPLPGPALWIE